MIINSITCQESSWAELKKAAEAGTLGDLIKTGDCIGCQFKNGDPLLLDVSRDENGKFFFILHDCLPDEHSMNESWGKLAAWGSSEMRDWLNTEVLHRLPDELQQIIVPTAIHQIVDGQDIITEDKLFLLSATQVFGEGKWTEREPEDKPLEIFAGERDRVKECGDRGTWFWWLRSPVSSSSTTFYNVNNGGASSSNGASNANGVAFSFCINP